jgi:hypothetical protein
VTDHAEGRQRVERDPRRRRAAERREQLDPHAAAGQSVQREHGFECGHAATGDDDAERSAGG